jgi:hypothetical protein
MKKRIIVIVDGYGNKSILNEKKRLKELLIFEKQSEKNIKIPTVDDNTIYRDLNNYTNKVQLPQKIKHNKKRPFHD